MLIEKQNMIAEHETFEKISGGETSKQGTIALCPIAETIPCWANNVGHYFLARKQYWFWTGILVQ